MFHNNWLNICVFVDLGFVFLFSLLRVGDFEVRDKVIGLFVSFLFAEEWVGFEIKCRVDVEGVVVRDADVVVEDVETGVAVLADGCFLFGAFLLIFVDGLLDHLIDVRVEMHVYLFRQDNRFDYQRWLSFLFLVLFDLLEDGLVDASIMRLPDMFLDVLILLADLVVTSTDHTIDGAFDYFDLAEQVSRLVIEVRVEVVLRMSADDWHWLDEIVRVKEGLLRRLVGLLGWEEN